MELTFLQFGKQLMQPEMSEDISDMFVVQVHVLGVDEDVVKIDNDTDVEHVSKNSVDKLLESCRGVGQAKRHYQPFIGSILCVEGSLPLIAWSDPD